MTQAERRALKQISLFMAERLMRYFKRHQPRKATAAGCLEWQGGRGKAGYGVVGVSMNPSRVAWILASGKLIPPDLYVCHKCDNPPCINPAHLFLGTAQENMDDMDRKGRRVVAKVPPKHRYKGTRHWSAKLDDARIRRIREKYALGESLNELASTYGVTKSVIWHAVTGKKWKHVGGPITKSRPTARGEGIVQSKLTEKQVREIKRKALKGMKQTHLAKNYGVSDTTISEIISGKKWAHVVLRERVTR